MARKITMRRLSKFLRKTSSSSSSSHSSTSDKDPITTPTPGRLSDLEPIISKWDVESSAASLFSGGREEARAFLLAVSDLNHVMRLHMTSSCTTAPSGELVRLRRLMATAVRRLENEFRRILVDVVRSADEEEDDDDDDLNSIAGCMISAGYGKECVVAYTDARRSFVEESIYRLGFERMKQSQMRTLGWEFIEQSIRTWMAAAKVVVKTLFSGEKKLCCKVFGSTTSDHINESCFAAVTGEPAVRFLEFPAIIANAPGRKDAKNVDYYVSSERMFLLLDVHDCIVGLSPEIQTVFSYETTAAVRSQTVSSLEKLCNSIRSDLAVFESRIHNHPVDEPAVPGGGIHPLTRRVMGDLARLSDHVPALAAVLHTSSSSEKFAWLLLVLLCKLDTMAEVYKDMRLSYLFLANNLRYVVGHVKSVGKLRESLGEEWVEKHDQKARSFAASYKRLAATAAAERRQ